jgi:membrane-associated protease RseP (regulator of RpoE activity)
MLPRVLGAALVVAALGACANDYASSYQSVPVPPPPAVQVVPFSGEPRVVAGSGDRDADILRLYEDGYGLIGYSSFEGPAGPREQVAAQARRVGAAVAVQYSLYQNTEYGAVPITTPTVQTAAPAGTPATLAPKTNYLPYSVDKYQQYALFFAPVERKGSGILGRNPTPEQRRRIGSNRGLVIVAVRKGSPASATGIVDGDILLAVNGQPVDGSAAAGSALLGARGTAVRLTLLRKGAQIERDVAIPQDEW